MFAHLLLWAIITAITFGLAAPFWLYSVVKLLLNGTELHEIDDLAPTPPAAGPSVEPTPRRQHVMPQPQLIIPKPPP